ncbi:MAG: endolytic transglycosylase MltG [Gammaproteobacteria bacterium]
MDLESEVGGDTPADQSSGGGKRPSWLKRLLILALVLVLALAVVAAVAWRHFQGFASSPLPIEKAVVVEIPPGTGVKLLAARLTEKGLIPDPYRFELLARVEKFASRIKAGEYQLEPGVSPRAALELFASGKVIAYSETLVEGWNFSQMMDAVRNSPILERTLPDLEPETVMKALGQEGVHPEGRFYPDTYLFPRGTTDVEFLSRAYRTMEAKLDEAWAARSAGLPLNTPYEALILASIVEKETAAPEERPRIAGVFVRRLQKGMRLQTDPTVIYGMGDLYKGNIRRRDLKTDTPYNTYTRKGLPPTPIAMPGGAALHAALHPLDGKTLYFVARGDGSGTHVFSETLKAHNRAVAEHQLKRRR